MARILNLAAVAVTLTMCLPPSAALSESGGLLHEDHPLAGRIWSTSNDEYVTASRVEEAVADAHYVLLGEIHDNPEHHRLQARLVSASAALGRKPALVFEMLPYTRQERVDAYLTEGGGDASAFGDAVGWAELGWPDYAMYQPIVEAALSAQLPIIAGDTPRAERRQVAQAGINSLGEETVQRLGLERPLGEPGQARLYDVLFEGHCEMMPREALSPMAGIQRLRDGRLADAMVTSASAHGEGAVLIAGGGHVRSDFGVPRYLEWRDPGKTTVTVGFVEVVEGLDAPTDYVSGMEEAPLFDFMWFTARAQREDPCERLRAHFENKSTKSSDP